MSISTEFSKILDEIDLAIRDRLHRKGECHIMLTGGRSATLLYHSWSVRLSAYPDLRGIHFYFGDERAVSFGHLESNYRLAVDALFPDGPPPMVEIHRMEGESYDLDAAAKRYEALLPEAIDILLLSMGEDGHIASLFPCSAALHEGLRKVVSVKGDKRPFQRLTITPPVIRCARQAYILALGKQKRVLYELALRDPNDVGLIPARLVLNRTWIFGD